jgi:hypothetical protein
MVNYFFETNLFKVQENFNYIFADAFHCGEFMLYTFDLHANNRITFQGIQQYTAKRITDRYTITWLQRAKFELCFEIRCFLQDDFVGLLEI